MKRRGWQMFVLLIFIGFIDAKIPKEYEEVEDHNNILFTVTEPYMLAYTYQMKHAFMLGTHFPDGINKTMKHMDMVLADPINGCETLRNIIFVPTVILMERGHVFLYEMFPVNKLIFSEVARSLKKAIHGQKAGASVVMVTDSENIEYGPQQYYVNMIPDESLDRADIPCVFVASITGRYFRDHLEEGGSITLDLPVEKNHAPWVHHQKRAPWENWTEDRHFI